MTGDKEQHSQIGNTKKFYRKNKKTARACTHPLHIMVVIEGPDKGREFTLLPCQMKIGRHPDNHIHLSDNRVSRKHAVLDYDRKLRKYLLTDLQSTNGTYLNDRRVEKGFLSPGDRIRAGSSILELVDLCGHEHDMTRRKEPVDERLGG